jgi:hypothetical protein
MNSAYFLMPIIMTITLIVCVSSAAEAPAGERMPLWDRIALSEVKIYTSEALDQHDPPALAKKGTWARFLRHSEKYTTELVEFESGGKFWIQETAMYPLYYVVGTTPLMVQVPHGVSKKPTDELSWSEEVIAYPGDVVAVDRWSQALLGTWLVYTPDGSKMGYAPSDRLQPAGDSGMGLAGD